MQLFKLKTIVHSIADFSTFAKEFQLSSDDLVITNQFIYDPFMKDCNLPCTFVMQEKYGQGEPSDEMMNQILNDIKDVKYKRVVAVGGGTVIDISKLFVLKGVKDVNDAFGRKVDLIKDKDLIIIPTTCGTGSEVTNISIAEIKHLHTKMGLADDAIVADHAVIIAPLLHGLPYRFYVASSIDALIHAVESYVSPKCNKYTEIFSVAAMDAIIDVFKKVAAITPEERHKYAEDMLIAANMAGVAFGNAGVGAVHALSYPLGGNYHVPHGESNYQFFTEVFKLYHTKNPNGRIATLEQHLAQKLSCEVHNVYDEMDKLLSKLTPRKKLNEYGMKKEECAEFAKAVIETQQRLLNNNYVPFTLEEIEGVYNRLY